MKRFICIIVLVFLIGVMLCSCGENGSADPTANTESSEPLKAPTMPEQSSAVQSETEQSVTETAAVLGTVDDYVGEARSKTVTFGDGVTNTLRIPEIKLDSEDAKAANEDIIEKLGGEFEDNSGVYAIDYEAAMRGSALSVVITASYEGGNSYGLCYNFDVVSGRKITDEELCRLIGSSYTEAVKKLRENLTKYYEEKYAQLPGNETEKERTVSQDNLDRAEIYINTNGELTAMTDIYAAVGGGHWVVDISAE